MKDFEMEVRKEEFVFLDELRASGIVNMYGASEYLMNEFGIKFNEAKEILKDWMNTYSPEVDSTKQRRR